MRPPAPAPEVPPQPAPTQPAPPPTEAGATIYQIDPQASALHVFVYRGGTFARLGHNHVMTSKSVTGRVWMRSQFPASGFELSFPVADLIVDDPDARRAAGTDFPPDIPAADKGGNAQEHASEGSAGRRDLSDGDGEIGDRRRLAASAEDHRAYHHQERNQRGDRANQHRREWRGRLTASGEFDILQTDFGMKPFSVALGALEVQDRLHVRFNLVAAQR